MKNWSVGQPTKACFNCNADRMFQRNSVSTDHDNHTAFKIAREEEASGQVQGHYCPQGTGVPKTDKFLCLHSLGQAVLMFPIYLKCVNYNEGENIRYTNLI